MGRLEDFERRYQIRYDSSPITRGYWVYTNRGGRWPDVNGWGLVPGNAFASTLYGARFKVWRLRRRGTGQETVVWEGA